MNLCFVILKYGFMLYIQQPNHREKHYIENLIRIRIKRKRFCAASWLTVRKKKKEKEEKEKKQTRENR